VAGGGPGASVAVGRGPARGWGGGRGRVVGAVPEGGRGGTVAGGGHGGGQPGPTRPGPGSGDYRLAWWVDAEQPELVGEQLAALGVAAGWVGHRLMVV